MNGRDITVSDIEMSEAEDFLKDNHPNLAAVNGAGRNIAIFVILLALFMFAVVFLDITNQGLSSIIERTFFIMAMPLILMRVVALMTVFIGDKEVKATFDFDDKDLPIYSLLIALYKEADVVPGLVNSLGNIDWPKDKIDIIFLCEQDDTKSIEALRKYRNNANYRIVTLPAGRLKTKPRALQAGLKYVRGEFTTIYDAEDTPHQFQLKQAYAKFVEKGENLAVVQAPLVTWNHRENWICAQFALDYAIWFRVIIPFFARIFKTFPLGGTSNHFRVNILREVGGWDPQNLTEDADLGARLAIYGYDADYITFPTYEESPPRINNWVRQRTRWIQGHMQTLSVLLRNINIAIKNKTLLKFFMVFFGIMIGPFYGAMRIQAFLILVLNFDALNYFLLFLISEFILAIYAIKKDGRNVLLLQIFTMPIYWGLQTIALFRASSRIFSMPYVWEKTDHGTCARQ